MAKIAAAGLDVFEGEPKLNPGYIELKNVFLLPHIGTATVESRANIGMVALSNIDAVLNGKASAIIAKGLGITDVKGPPSAGLCFLFHDRI